MSDAIDPEYVQQLELKYKLLQDKVAHLEGRQPAPGHEAIHSWAVMFYKKALENNPRCRPGEFASALLHHEQTCKDAFFNGDYLPDAKTIIRWVKHLAPPEAKRRGRPPAKR